MNVLQSRELLEGSYRPLLVTHIAPDGDAAGSLLALGWALERLGKQPLLVCSDPIPPRFGFLPGFDGVTQKPKGSFDLCVVLDCSDRARMGRMAGVEGVPLLNIDHHVTNRRFGTVNLVDVEAVSTTHILYRLTRELGVEMDERLATCLLTGITTDTRGFRTSNVTAEVLRLAVELVEAGAPLPLIVRNGLERRSLNMLQMWGAALSRLRMEDGIIWTSVPVEVWKAAGSNGSSGLSSLLISVAEAQVSAVFLEREDGQVEVGLRARPGFNVARVALAMGGGGHTLAAGCLVPGPLEEAQRRVLGVLREDLARQRERTAGD